ncbi:hypothetical protein K4K61_004824 [Colletotrichum sp. SAR11_59]|nr:hypothetical protein K4K61_004824 [Colletotrichum sp. SAR11_59]
MSGHPPSPPQPPLPGSRTPLDPPSPASVWVADNWHSVIFGTVTSHFLHFRYLNSHHKPDPNPVKNARFWAGLGVPSDLDLTKHNSPATMSADFWAGYISGAVGIIIGNPLDLLKVRLQAPPTAPPPGQIPAAAATSYIRHFETPASLVTGSAAPILGYGALNALLFVSYNRTEAALNSALNVKSSLWTTWIAGAVGGLATWVVSTPTELIKCRAQLSSPPASSWAITKDVWRAEGIRGLYFGGVVTALRDSIGYGFYFWSYELSTRWMGVGTADATGETNLREEAAKVLLCGGLAGIVTWASIFPLDVIKTRVQTQAFEKPAEAAPLLPTQGSEPTKRAGAMQVAREAYREGGMKVFFRGLTICSVRAFIVNAVQWAVYEWAMYEMGEGRRRPGAALDVGQPIENADSFYEEDWLKVFAEQLIRFLRTQAPNLGLRPRDASDPVRLLDYACAHGGASWALDPFVDEILGIDVAPAIVERFKKNATRLGYDSSRAHAIAGDLMTDASLAGPAPFDVVIISMALHHLDDPPAMLAFDEEVFRTWFEAAGCEGKFVYIVNDEVSHIPEKASGKAGGLNRKMVIAAAMKE